MQTAYASSSLHRAPCLLERDGHIGHMDTTVVAITTFIAMQFEAASRPINDSHCDNT